MEKKNAISAGLALFLVLTVFGAEFTPFESAAPLKPQNRIDELVLAQLKKLDIEPARPCSDAVFVRRVFLDVIGTLPTGLEAQQFLLDRSPDKRRLLIERLLARDEFADYWAMKWGDLLRVKAEFPINLWPNAAQSYHRWLHDSIRDNKPIDRFARELLTASGSNFQKPPVNFYRAMQNRTPEGIAKTVALTFMGVRAEHWPTNKLVGMAVFFANVGYKTTAEWKEEIVFFNPASTNVGALNGSSVNAVFPDGSRVKLSPENDPRAVFADWLVDRKNPWFARSMANRAWSWLLGRGIVHEPDDLRFDNPPSNPQLLAYLEQELISSGYDMKHLFRLILNSQTYQLSSVPQSVKSGATDNFASYPIRRLDAEVLIDAVNQVTSTNEHYSSAIPEPYTFIPDDLRSISLPDGSITSPFLEMFGRPSRDTGVESERNNRISASQKLNLINSSQMLKKIEQSRMIAFQLAADNTKPAQPAPRRQGQRPQAKPEPKAPPVRTPAEIATGLYLGILSRYPAPQEIKVAQDYFQAAGNRRQAAVDLAWALLNSSEFLYRH